MPSEGQNGLSRLVSLTSRSPIATSASLPVGMRNVAVTASFADEVERDLAPERLEPVLPDVDALPDAERQTALGDWDRQLHGGERRAHVRRHVVESLVAMAKDRIAVRDEAGEEAIEIGAHLGRRVLLDQQARRRVADEERHQAALRAEFDDPRGDRLGDLEQAAAEGVD